MSVLQRFRASSTLKAPIFLPTVLFVLLTATFCSLFPEESKMALNTLKQDVFAHFSWFYILSASIFFLFLMFLCVSSLGGIRLGADSDEPEYSFWSWIAMLFAAGMGIGLMYFGVTEPVLHYLKPVERGLSESERMREAMMTSFYHWGIHAWAIYAVVALALAYFGFRYRLPLTVRSGFYPLLKNRISGNLGHIIDAVALCSTILGLTTTLGYGAMQVSAGFKHLGWLEDSGFGVLALIVLIALVLAVVSAVSGVGRGVRLLSETNLVLAGLLLLFVLSAGPTLLLLSGLTENLGHYFSSLLEMSFRTFAYEPEKQEWLSSWTVVYWAWWASWAPFVGMFIAKISKGRTIREFVLGVLFVPSLFNILWMTAFGGTALWMERVNEGVLAAYSGNTEAMLFAFFSHLPFGTLTSVLALAIILVFFVTSADSGIFVLNSIASQGAEKSPKWQSVFWGILLAVLGLPLLYSGGLDSLQALTLIIALPFMLIMLALCFGLWKGLIADSQYSDKEFLQGSSSWTGRYWKMRLAKILNQSSKEDVAHFMTETARPAFEELAAEFAAYNLTVKTNVSDGINPKAEFEVVKENLRNFLYGIECRSRRMSDLVVEDGNMPHIGSSKSYKPVTYFADGRRGYDVGHMSREELIADVLKQYERFTNLAMDDSHALMTADVGGMTQSDVAETLSDAV